MEDQKSIQYMLLAGFFFALMNISVKLVSHLPTMEVVLFRSVISLLASYAILRKQNIPVFGNNKKLLIARGIAGCLGLVGSFYTLQNIPLASAVTINYTAPLFTTILGIFMVKQYVKPIQFLFFGMAIAGVLMMKGFDSRISNFDLAVGLMSALFAAIAYNIIAKIKTSEHPLVIIFYFPLITIPFVGIYSIFDWKTPQGIDWFYLLLVGILTQLAQYYMTLSYQTANLSKVSSLTYLGVVYALGIGFFFFEETYSLYSLLGIGLIILAILFNMRVKTSK
ncbi:MULTISPECIES: DMT family transporter [Sphingobacterium]|uniref:DMT family transporter n=1 Tax=Sphingobacterium TaxID=28453 RepID=UPI001BE403A6|nr:MULTISPECIES: DMT family transporter [Sphingobacterium]MBV2227895.1 DMT family transporter [Sphingobacterium mizutaii]